jgi:hypothetical protein
LDITFYRETSVTNYCQNRLTIEGSPAEIGAFAQGCLSLHGGLHLLDFEKILSMPPVLKGVRRSDVSKLGGEFPNQLSSGVVGMEALTRKPVQPVDGVTQARSVLDHARVQEVGSEVMMTSTFGCAPTTPPRSNWAANVSPRSMCVAVTLKTIGCSANGAAIPIARIIARPI